MPADQVEPSVFAWRLERHRAGFPGANFGLPHRDYSHLEATDHVRPPASLSLSPSLCLSLPLCPLWSTDHVHAPPGLFLQLGCRLLSVW